MDFLNQIRQATQNFINPVIQGGEQAASNVGNAISQGFQNFVAKPVENLGESAYNAVNQNFYQQNPNNPQLPIGLSGYNNPINNFIAQTPQYLQQGAQAADNWIGNTFGDNIGSNAAKDVVNTGAGLLSLPGMAAQIGQDPTKLPSTIGSMGQGLWNEYSDLIQHPIQHFEQHPVNSILDVLPILSLGKLAMAGKAGEVGDVATAANVAGDTTNAVTAAMSPQERLANLLNYPEQLASKGYSQEMIDQLSAPKAAQLLDKNIPPDVFAKNPDILNTDEASVQHATAMSELANPNSLSLIKGLPQTVQNYFKDWVNGRAAAPIQAQADAQQFAKYDSLGQQGFTQFQNNPSQFADLHNFLDQKYQELQKAGVDVNYIGNNYLPQIWQSDKGAAAIGKTLNPTNAPFSFERVVDSYEEGIANGLTPKYNTLGQLAQWYSQTAGKLLEDKSFFDNLRNDSLIQPATKAPQGWMDLGQGFPKNQVTLADNSTYGGTYAAPPNLAKAINNYLAPQDGLLNSAANIQSGIKNTVLSSGIPGTGINWHGLSTLVRQTLSSNNPIAGFWTGAKYLINPRIAQAAIDSDLAGAANAVKSGLNLSIEDHNFFTNIEPPKGIMGNVANTWKNVFETPLFSQAIPALKLNRYNGILNQLVQSGMDAEQAGKIAAEQTNSIFGGKNLQQIARSTQTQDLLRNIVFAPDWAENSIDVGKGIVQGLANPTNPVGQVYRTMARNLVMSYIALNLTNKATSGHYAFQNAPGHQFDLDTGGYTNDGQKRYIVPFASGIDFVKVPFDFLSSALGGNSTKAMSVVRNRIAPVPGEVMSQLTNQNYLGQPLFPKGATGAEQWLGRGTEALSSVVPPQLGAAARYLSGNQGAEQAITAGMQAPVRYGSGATTTAEKNQVALMQAGGATGDQIGQGLTQYKQQQAAKYATNPYAPGQPSVFDSMFKWLGFPKQDPTVNKQAAVQSDPLLAALDKQGKVDAQTKTIKDIYTSGMAPDEIQKALAAKGIDPMTAQETMLKSLTDVNRAPLVKSMLAQAGNTPAYEQVVGELARKGVLTSSLVSQFVKNGDITTQQQTALDNAIKLANNESVKGYSTYNGGTATTSSRAYSSRVPSGVSMSLPNAAIHLTPFNTAAQIQAPIPKMPTLTTQKPTGLEAAKAGFSKFNNDANAAPFWTGIAANARSNAPSATMPGQTPKITAGFNFKIPNFKPTLPTGGGTGFNQGLSGYSQYSSGAGFK